MPEISIQTEEFLLYNYAWEKFYHHFQQAVASEATAAPSANSNSEPSKTDSITNDMNAINISSELVPIKNGLYFDPKTALYYDTEKQLYFDLENKTKKAWYCYKKIEQTGTYHLRYKSKISHRDKKILFRKLELKEDDEPNNGENDDIIILSDDGSVEKNLNDDTDDNSSDIVELTNKYPPCIRVILVESKNSKLGTLFVIPYTGGSIGSNSSRNLIDFPYESDIEKNHAGIEYNLKEKQYYIEDKNSRSGTYLNDIRIAQNKKYKISHGDFLRIGQNLMLLHIHTGSITCVKCEPGEVIAKLKKDEESARSWRKNEQDKESYRRATLNDLKKKHGIKWNDIDKNRSNDSIYVDKAKIRRSTVGIDLSHIEYENSSVAVASTDNSICKSNKGFKLLKSMGWTEGRGLGKNETGIIEPVSTEIRTSTTGLGFVETNPRQTLKKISWTKTQTRYNQSQTKTICLPKSSTVCEVFNIESSEEEK